MWAKWAVQVDVALREHMPLHCSRGLALLRWRAPLLTKVLLILKGVQGMLERKEALAARRRCAIFSILASLSSVPLVAEPQTQQVAGAVQAAVSVQSVSIGSPTATSGGNIPVEVVLQNTSTKPIYAFRIKLTTVWADGSSKSAESTIDLLGLYVVAENGPHLSPQPAIFRSGETYTWMGGTSRAKDGAAPVSAAAAISMLAFGDRTAIGSHEDVESFSRLRIRQADQYSGIVADLQLVVQASDPVKAAEARSRELLTPRASDPKVSDGRGQRLSPNGSRARTMLMLVRSVDGDKFRLGKTIADNQAFVQALRQHAVLQEVIK
jgi:hypothetical protein